MLLGFVSIEFAQRGLLVLFAVTAIITDWRRQHIYNLTTYPVIVVGLGLSAFQDLPGEVFKSGLADHLVAAVGVFALLYPLYAMRWMLAGDLKLLMAIGALMGTWFLMLAFVYGSLIGGALAIGFVAVALVRGQGFERGLKAYMPYGIALAAGSLVALVTGVAR